MSFWQELKRRNVFRVGAVYLAIAWLIAQIVSVVILLLAAGFPVALVSGRTIDFAIIAALVAALGLMLWHRGAPAPRRRKTRSPL
jgi:hypothetical protein